MIFILQLPQPLGFVYVDAPLLGLPRVNRELRDAHLAAYFLRWSPRLQLLQRPNHLASLCFPFDMALLLAPQNHIHFPAHCGGQVTGPKPRKRTLIAAAVFAVNGCQR